MAATKTAQPAAAVGTSRVGLATSTSLSRGLPPLAEAEAAFHAAFPAYAGTSELDELRASEYARLDRLGHVYLDYTGGGLYARSQILSHQKLLLRGVFGNPHSTNPTSMAATRMADEARSSVLDYFHASPDEYVVIFTPNASGALKLVAEAYPFAPGGKCLLLFDNHNSVNGIREFARTKGADVIYSPVLPPDLRIDDARLVANLGRAERDRANLFAYPAQSNFSGGQHPLDWIDVAHAAGWDVILDSAAFVPTNGLDLTRWHPDFVPVSFYKMFGYPTGIGCLLARKAALAKLHRPWFAGGTITVASVQGDRYFLQEGAAGFEDGTLNYLMLPAVRIGLQHLTAVGMAAIHTRVDCLTEWLLRDLAALRHGNGEPLVRIFGPLDMRQRGATLTLNLYDPNERFIDHERVESRANARRISLRTGCFCNPGGGEVALGLAPGELTACFTAAKDRFTIDDFRRCIDAKSTGAVRVSMGLVTNFRDVYHFATFVRGFLDKGADEV